MPKLKSIPQTREFRFGEKILPDPGSSYDLEAVRRFHSNYFPELLNANASSATTDNHTVYTFSQQIGKKG